MDQKPPPATVEAILRDVAPTHCARIGAENVKDICRYRDISLTDAVGRRLPASEAVAYVANLATIIAAVWPAIASFFKKKKKQPTHEEIDAIFIAQYPGAEKLPADVKAKLYVAIAKYKE